MSIGADTMLFVVVPNPIIRFTIETLVDPKTMESALVEVACVHYTLAHLVHTMTVRQSIRPIAILYVSLRYST